MEKKLRVLFTIIMATVMLFALAVPAAAETEFEFDSNPHCIWSISIDEGREYTGFCDRVAEGYKLYSNNEEILSVEADGTLIAKSEGYAVIAELYEGELGYYYGFTVKAQPKTESDTFNEIVNEQREQFNSIREKQEDEIHVMDILGPILIVLVVSLVLAEIGYIFVTAPKYGMSRLWALAPIIGNVFGLVVFLVLRTIAKQNTATTTNVIVCPVCNGRHPYGTTVCSICGTKLSK